MCVNVNKKDYDQIALYVTGYRLGTGISYTCTAMHYKPAFIVA